MVAVGITNKGKRLEFDCNTGILLCSNRDLISLELPEGVINVWCSNNKLSELTIPKSVTSLFCDKEVSGLEEFICKIYIYLW